MSRRTFIVRPEADKVHGCYRCGARLRAGERATISHVRSIVTVQHAGRRCPPLTPRGVAPVPSRYVN